jgi:hypothetical protein
MQNHLGNINCFDFHTRHAYFNMEMLMGNKSLF